MIRDTFGSSSLCRPRGWEGEQDHFPRPYGPGSLCNARRAVGIGNLSSLDSSEDSRQFMFHLQNCLKPEGSIIPGRRPTKLLAMAKSLD